MKAKLRAIEDDDVLCTDVDEENGASLPWSSASLQERYNPFHPTRPINEVNFRGFTLTQKKADSSPSAISQASEADFSMIGEVKDRAEVASCGATSPPLETEQRKIKLRLVDQKIPFEVYQKTMNQELKEYFDRLGTFQKIEMERVNRHKAKLRPLDTFGHKKTLVLDLDGTLICSLYKAKNYQPDVDIKREVGVIKLKDEEGIPSEVEFLVRPFTTKLLKILHIFYEIIVNFIQTRL